MGCTDATAPPTASGRWAVACRRPGAAQLTCDGVPDGVAVPVSDADGVTEGEGELEGVTDGLAPGDSVDDTDGVLEAVAVFERVFVLVDDSVGLFCAAHEGGRLKELTAITADNGAGPDSVRGLRRLTDGVGLGVGGVYAQYRLMLPLVPA
jgi:hypothetical protein